jgi:ADP-ribosylglycohydrolase
MASNNTGMASFLLGTAIGDAFGAGVEFQDRDWIRANADFTAFVNARHLIRASDVAPHIFTENYQPWDYTDDTEMTLGLLQALLSGQPFTPDLLIAYWTKEYQRGILEKGYGRNGHGSMRWVFNGEKSINEVRDFQRKRPNPGNAPAIRAALLGLLPEPLIDTYAVINADATHPHPKARAASIIVARAAKFLWIENGSAADLIPYCLEHIQYIDQETAQYLQEVNKLPPPTVINEQELEILLGPQPIVAPYFLPGIKGLSSDAMLTAGAVLWILKYAATAFDGLKTAIYLGGDVDSVAAVCTGILAGKYGLADLPEFMMDNVEGKMYLKKMAAQFISNNY